MSNFITRQHFLVNLLLAILLLAVMIFFFFSSLDWITQHDENIKVPAVTGRHIDEAVQILESQGFEVAVKDSVYIDTAAKAAVIRQTPDADAIVKKNRTIYLTINRAVAPLIDMPDLRGFSFESARMYLQSIGLKLGDTSYRPDIARNSVLEQRLNNQLLLPGTKVSMGSSINFVLGDGIGSDQMNVPNLTGMTLGDARSYLGSLNIGIGAVVADPDVSDQESAFIYRQNPPPVSDNGYMKNKIHPGQAIDVYLSTQQPAVEEAPSSTEEEEE